MEKFDLYDKNRLPLGKTVERGQSIPVGCYRMVVHIAIFGSDGKMLIQKRAQEKSSWADLWDFSVGGHVSAGEKSSEGAARELFEELGISTDAESLCPAFTLNFLNGFDDYYILASDISGEELVLQKEEVQAVSHAGMDEILAMIDSGEFIPYKKSLVYLLFEMKNSIGAHK